MPGDEIKIEICSPPDREKLVSCLMVTFENPVDGIEGGQFAEINQESADLQIEIYPRRDGKPWTFDLDRLMQCLEHARHVLGH